MEKKQLKLAPDLAGKFKIVGNPVGQRFEHPRFGRIDFEKLTLQQAEALAKSKHFPYLEKVESTAPAITKKS
ncbi:hypothetical protein [Roseivirga thermotolerans]|uniref:Uncharacterized protein n=1 Tax=Roseivirga thermotolerans TaxID=1758176 RepID=A0ABQ3I5W5_9BACT|nr:hypothetical protein [Roseivirga thermotolerans]GHE64921.1 hypothetical protein GCM10011340_19910 [Roseivirga thermotolerans]